MSESSVTVHLPYPPSANKLWRAVNGRNIKSETYRLWLAEAGLRLMAQRCKPVDGAFHLRLYATRPDNRRRDIDNIIKPCADALKAAGLFRDDSDAESVFATWRAKGLEPGVLAVIEPVGTAEAVAA